MDASLAIRAPEITVALRELLRSSNPGSAVLSEVSCGGGRVDVALVSGTSVHFFEVKSDRDSTARVEFQLRTFARGCDFLTLVAGRKLAVTLLREVPNWCGVTLAIRGRSGGVEFLTLRRARPNPLLDASVMGTILRREELVRAIRHSGRSSDMRRRLADLPRTVASTAVAEVLRQRWPQIPPTQQGSGGG